MQDTYITVQGRVATDPEMKVSKNNNPFASFKIASTPRHQVSGAPGTYEDGETSWYRVFAWGNLGANLLRSIEKGQPVVVHGRISSREFKKDDGTYGSSVSIVANSVGHDLSWGQAAYEKVARPTYGDGDRHDEALETIRDEEESFGDPERTAYDTAGESDTGPLVGHNAA
ncbi:single-strand DNA-binding protein [Knoellia remsis]|uniref:Single-stranded DNA-binding protein n=1 Tax=Knoellia remsis TaxID=407159 RepID=A0A2T0UU40_9MICO|nr:single-stranded DNA-binding protein [Knoellia remsis]PRY61357.1 single-strand DNA-binding protein [Knoellia remsis]